MPACLWVRRGLLRKVMVCGIGDDGDGLSDVDGQNGDGHGTADEEDMYRPCCKNW